MLFCTWGADGAYSCQVPMGECISAITHTPACLPTSDAKVVDPVGAGDAFIAGVLYSLNTSPHSDHAKAALVGCQLAGQKIIQVGFDNLGRTWRESVASLKILDQYELFVE
jgi:ketohexokinase